MIISGVMEKERNQCQTHKIFTLTVCPQRQQQKVVIDHIKWDELPSWMSLTLWDCRSEGESGLLCGRLSNRRNETSSQIIFFEISNNICRILHFAVVKCFSYLAFILVSLKVILYFYTDRYRVHTLYHIPNSELCFKIDSTEWLINLLKS